MATSASMQLVIAAINSANAATISTPLTQADVVISAPIANTLADGNEVQGTVSAVAGGVVPSDSPTVDVSWNRVDFAVYFTGIDVDVTLAHDTPEVPLTNNMIIDAVNAKYGTTIEHADITPETAGDNSYIEGDLGFATVLTATATSFGYKGSLNVHVTYPQENLEDLIKVTKLNALAPTAPVDPAA